MDWREFLGVGVTAPPHPVQAAGRYLREKANGTIVKRGNPFGKAWGLQVDGDLWEVAWNAVLKRGIGNQFLRKVKGHATEDDVRKGIATKEDREGNDISDKLADKGVEEVAGIGLVKLGKWFEDRMNKYKKLVTRCQKMIISVTQVEKRERGKSMRSRKRHLAMIQKSGSARKRESETRSTMR